MMILDERQIETIADEILQIGETSFNKYICEITEHGYWLLQEKKRGPIGKMDMKL
nr:MAG TPA: hypothetical protein [Caudoviricetes sp.]